MSKQINENDIAIVGMAGRFPKSPDIESFWDNLENGRECISFFTDEELIAKGVSKSLINDENYVKAGGVVEDAKTFDASFFGYTPREAEIMDPQHRKFLECAWESLEDAGYANVDTEDLRVGVFAGSTMNTYMLNNLVSSREMIDLMGDQQMMIANDKDYLASRVSYKFNLKGPSMAVQTACSSSLVSVHMAAQSLLTGECDMVIAGGSSIRVPIGEGYMYNPSGTSSKDGKCRAFDADATGSVVGNGAGVIILKRLSEAIKDNDNVHAVIKATNINNDGSQKAGFTAPSVEGQARAITECLALANIDPTTIGYVEAHGTGTNIGDPIEFAALSKAFNSSTTKQEKGYCALGSVKTNIGHLDSAAGISGLIKTVLSIKNKKIPATLNFKKPNAEIDLENSPFFISNQTKEWDTKSTRRAGVGSTGMGGTNSFVILEEAPNSKKDEGKKSSNLFPVSARNEEDLKNLKVKLGEFFKANRNINLEDVAYTLQQGRKGFNYRSYFIAKNIDELINLLEEEKQDISKPTTSPNIAFFFPGQGTQFVNMSKKLYEEIPFYKGVLDKLMKMMGEFGNELLSSLFSDKKQDILKINNSKYSDPLMFSIGYSLAQMWLSLGVKPKVTLGTGVGEYVAATVAGMINVEDGLKLSKLRGELLSDSPKGNVLNVKASLEEIKPFLEKGLYVHSILDSKEYVISGPKKQVNELEEVLSEIGVVCRKLYNINAIKDVDLNKLKEAIEPIHFKNPELKMISTISGELLNYDNYDRSYLLENLIQPVDLKKASSLLKNNFDITINCGASISPSDAPLDNQVLHSLAKHRDSNCDLEVLYSSLGYIWSNGVEVNWRQFNDNAKTISLPTYPFDKREYWIEQNRLLPNSNYNSIKDNISGEEAPPKNDIYEETRVKNAGKTTPKANKVDDSLYARPNLQTEYKAPRTKLEKELAVLWSEFTGIEKVGINDNLFDLGGHSLMATQIISRLRSDYAVDIPMSVLFDKSTIAGVADEISNTKNDMEVKEQVPGTVDDELEDALTELENLTDEEVKLIIEQSMGGK